MKIEDLLNSDSSTSCPDAVTLEKYISGKLSASEQHDIERHLIDCEFCEEALEGLKLISYKGVLSSIQNDLEESLQRKINPVSEGRIRVLFSWKIAAAFALLIGSMSLLWFFIPREDSSQLFTQEFKPYPAPSPIPNTEVQTMESVPASEKHSEEVKAREEKRQQPSEPASDRITSARSTDQGESAATLSSVPEVSSKADDDPSDIAVLSQAAQEEVSHKEAKYSESVKSKDNVLNKEVSEAEATTAAVRKATSTSSREKQAGGSIKTSDNIINADFDAGLAAYQKQDYSLAISYFSKLKEPPDARFYLGLSFLASDQPEPALQEFKSYLEKKGSTRKEAAHWYAALAAIKLDRKREARHFLQKVIPFHGEFEAEAGELLKKL
jgi:TolA-binding protein